LGEILKNLDIPYTTLNKIEVGVVKQPRVGTVDKIAKALEY